MADEDNKESGQQPAENAPPAPEPDKPTPYKNSVHKKSLDRPESYGTKKVQEGESRDSD